MLRIAVSEREVRVAGQQPGERHPDESEIQRLARIAVDRVTEPTGAS
ncbi:hypothetical protein AB0D78_38160 [Streptomyces avermitilis]